MSVFSVRLRELRKKNSKKQTEIADYIGVVSRTLRHYEAGQAIPDIERLIKIADFFDVSADYLLGRSDNPRRQ